MQEPWVRDPFFLQRRKRSPPVFGDSATYCPLGAAATHTAEGPLLPVGAGRGVGTREELPEKRVEVELVMRRPSPPGFTLGEGQGRPAAAQGGQVSGLTRGGEWRRPASARNHALPPPRFRRAGFLAGWAERTRRTRAPEKRSQGRDP